MSYKNQYNNNQPNRYNRSQSMGMNQPPRYNNNMNNNNQQLDNFFRFNDGFQMDNFDNFDEDPFSFGFFRSNNQNNPVSNHINSIMNQMQNMEKEMFNQIGNDFNNQISTFQDRNNQAINIRSGGANPGTFISKSYVQKIDYSQGGDPIKEVYQSQAINQRGSDGHNISEKQEAYKNSKTGVEKAAHQRVLDGKGAKLIKQRNRFTGEQEEHNIFKGINENELESFNQNYNDYRNKSNFQKNYEYLNKINPRQIAGGFNNNYNRLPGNNNNNFNNNYNRPQGYLPDNNYNQNQNMNNNNYGNNNFNGNNNYNRGNTYNPNNNYNRNGY
jgi:hypothetical protein